MITALCGTNSLLLRAELKKRIDEFVAEHGDFALERLEADEIEFEKITDSLQSIPFLASKKLVILNQPGAQKQFAENLEELLKTVPETTDVIIVEPKPDRRSIYYKALKKLTEFKEFNELDERGLANWLVQAAKDQGSSLSFGDATHLVQRVGSSQVGLQHELEKLMLYDPKITRQTIDTLTAELPQGSVFSLLDAAFAGRAKEATKLYREQRRAKVDPHAIIAMLAWQLHAMALVKAAGARTTDEIITQAKLSPFVVRKTQNLVRDLTMNDIKQLIHEVSELDVRLKTESLDADEALEDLIISMNY